MPTHHESRVIQLSDSVHVDYTLQGWLEGFQFSYAEILWLPLLHSNLPTGKSANTPAQLSQLGEQS